MASSELLVLLQVHAFMWLIMMATVGGVSFGLAWFTPRWRRFIPVAISTMLGIMGLGLAATVLVDASPSEVELILVGSVLWAGGSNTWWMLPLGLAIGFGGAWSAFHCERLLLKIRLRPVLALLDLSFGLPGRAESMAGVALVAKNPTRFLLFSVWAALGEEFLFRGAMLIPLWSDSSHPLLNPGLTLWLIVSQAAFFAGIHVAFGWRTLVAKFWLGLVLGVATLMGGVLLSGLIPHMFHQWLVLRQFRSTLNNQPRPRRALAASHSLSSEDNGLEGIPVPSPRLERRMGGV